MTLLAVSDVVWQAAIGAIVTIVLAWMAERTKNMVKTTGADAAKNVAEVKATLAQNTTVTNDKLDVIHDLVNNEMHVALTEAFEAARKLAALTGDIEDIKKAEQAKLKLAAHDRQQVIADKGKAERNV